MHPKDSYDPAQKRSRYLSDAVHERGTGNERSDFYRAESPEVCSRALPLLLAIFFSVRSNDEPFRWTVHQGTCIDDENMTPARTKRSVQASWRVSTGPTAIDIGR